MCFSGTSHSLVSQQGSSGAWPQKPVQADYTLWACLCPWTVTGQRTTLVPGFVIRPCAEEVPTGVFLQFQLARAGLRVGFTLVKCRARQEHLKIVGTVLTFPRCWSWGVQNRHGGESPCEERVL